MRQLINLMGIGAETTVLDVGGSELNWTYLHFTPKVTILNLVPEGERNRFRWVFGDARRIPFSNKSFDVVFSNSAIEHLECFGDQMQAASEIRRVGLRYYVQTPNFWFPFDVHMLCPFFHWLPASFRKHLMRNFTLWGWIHRPPSEDVKRVAATIQLLTAKRMRVLFPEANLVEERVLGLTKSLIAICPARAIESGRPATPPLSSC